MSALYVAFSWVFGVLFLLMGMILFVESFLIGLPLVVGALLLLPPVRKFIFIKTNKILHGSVRVFFVTTLAFISLMLIVQTQESKKQLEAEQEAAKQAIIVNKITKEKAEQKAIAQQEKIKLFNKNKEKIISEIKLLVENKEYESAVSHAKLYLIANDKDLTDLYQDVKEKIEFIEIRKKMIKEQFSVWDGSHIKIEKLIKENMHDPDSYKHAKTQYADKGDHFVIKTSYRGKNLYGGMVLNEAIIEVSLDGNILRVVSEN